MAARGVDFVRTFKAMLHQTCDEQELEKYDRKNMKNINNQQRNNVKKKTEKGTKIAKFVKSSK